MLNPRRMLLLFLISTVMLFHITRESFTQRAKKKEEKKKYKMCEINGH